MRKVRWLVAMAVGLACAPAAAQAQISKSGTLLLEKSSAAGWLLVLEAESGAVVAECAEGCGGKRIELPAGTYVLRVPATTGAALAGWRNECAETPRDGSCVVQLAAGSELATFAVITDHEADEGTAEPPVVEDARFPEGTTNAKGFEFAAVARDSGAGVARVEYRLVPAGACDRECPAPFAVSSREDGADFRAVMLYEALGVPDGSYRVEIQAFDFGGRGSALFADGQIKVMIDRVAPALTKATTGPSGLVNTGRPPFVVEQTESGPFACTDNGKAFPCGAGTRATISQTFADGDHTVVVTPIDEAGNRGAPRTFTFTVDTVAPQISFGAHPSPFTSAVAEIPFSVTDVRGVTVTCARDGEPFRPCSGVASDTWTAATNGDHRLSVHAVDAAGNAAEATRPFRVAIVGAGPVAPETRILAGPADGATVSGAATFVLESDDPGARLACRVYAKGSPPPAFGPCSGPGARHTVSGLAPGTYVFEVTSTKTDGATDATPASRSFVVPGAGTVDQGGTGTKAAGIVTGRFGKGAVTTVRFLKVTRLAKGASVTVRCKGKGCPRKLKVPAPKGGAVDLGRLFRRARLKPGAVITITIRQPGAADRVVRFTMVKRKAPKRTIA